MYSKYVYQLMGVFCYRLKFGSTAVHDCRTGQNKGGYCKKELLFLLVLLVSNHVLQKVFEKLILTGHNLSERTHVHWVRCT